MHDSSILSRIVRQLPTRRPSPPARVEAMAILFSLLLVSSSAVPFLAFVSPVGTASAAADKPTLLADDFEDEPADSGLPDNWYETGGESLTTVEVTTAKSASGSQSFHVNDTSGNFSHFYHDEYPYPNRMTTNVSLSIFHVGGTGGSTDIHLHDSDENNGRRIDVSVNDNGLNYVKPADDTATTLLAKGMGVGEWADITVYDIDPKNDTFDLKAVNATSTRTWKDLGMREPMQSEGYDNIEIAHKGEAYVDNLKWYGAELEGVVRNQNGDPVEDATVQVWPANYNAYSGTQTEIREKVEADVQNASNPIPGSFVENLQLKGSAGEFENADGRYVAAFTDPLAGSDAPFTDTADLAKPQTQFSGDNPIVLTAWDPAGGFLSNSLVADEYSRQLPGEVQDSATIVIEQLDGGDSVIGRREVSLNRTYGGGIADLSTLHYAEVNLPPGFYRVKVKNSDYPGYVIRVGSLTELIDSSLTTVDGAVANQSKTVRDLLENKKFEGSVELETDAEGKFRLGISDYNRLKTVTVQAYKAPDAAVKADDLTLSDVRDVTTNASQVNASFYLPTQPKVVDPPKGGVTLTMVEAGWPYGGQMAPFDERWRSFLSGLFNQSYGKLASLLDTRSTDYSSGELQDIHTELQRLAEQNDQLRDQYQENLEAALGQQNPDVIVDSGSTDDQELQARIQALQQTMAELQNSVKQLESGTEATNQTVSSYATFNRPLNQDQVTVVGRWSNGSSFVVPSEYISLDTSTFPNVDSAGSVHRTTTVRVEDYPVGENDPAMLSFEYRIATADGIGGARNAVENPTFTGDPPDVDSFRLDTIAPGPDDRVTIEANPAEGSSFQAITNYEVIAPNGSTIATTTITNGTQTTFKTDGAGVYTVRATMSTDSGASFVETFRVEAGENNEERPASIRAASGPTGVYALVGDGLSDGRVDVSNAGGEVAVTAVVPSKADTPESVHVYTDSLTTSPDSTATVRVLRGQSEESVRDRVGIVWHEKRLTDDAIVYRIESGDSQPISEEGTQYGTLHRNDSTTIIETYTDGSGAAKIRTVNNPTLIQKAVYFARTNIPINVPFATGFQLPDAVGAGGFGVGSFAFVAFVSRRWSL